MDSQGGSMDSMVPVPVNTTEEIRRIVREELHRRNRPASINCFERTQTLIRGAATAVRRNINNQTVYFFFLNFIFYLFNVDIKTEYIFRIYQKNS